MRRPALALVLVASLGLGLPSAALAEPGRQFPDPSTGIREDTPNDPRFDCSEPDDEDGPAAACSSQWDAQSQLWGFAPSRTRSTAVHRTGPRAGQPMRSGISADVAWKTSIGRADVVVAILDTGIRWDNAGLRRQIALNAGELPSVPDLDGDGVASVADFEALVDPARGPNGNPGLVDAEDILLTYSDGVDDDANGYVDDVAGWDFFDDDNNAHDASSYSSASNHGTGRASDAADGGNDGQGEIGVCPECSILPVRVWDTFVVSGDQYGLGAVFSADSGAAVIQVALGALSNSEFSQAATRYAYEKGTTLAVVSSDLNTANHNYPTNYNEPIFINGVVADTYGGGNEFALPGGGGNLGADAPVGTYFRNSNLTQYGAHAHVGTVGDTGSFATGQAAGAFGVLIAASREKAATIGGPLTPGELKQIVTLTAEDVDAPDTIGAGVPDPAQPGFDERFGYGRLDLGAAIAKVAPGKVPPSVLLRTPRWWQLVDPQGPDVEVLADSGSRNGEHSVVVEAARGIEPTAFTPLFSAGPFTDTVDARDMGSITTASLRALFPAGTNFTAPPTDINQFAVTVRIRVTDALGNVGEDRRVLWLHRDADLLPGWPRFVDTGGESSLRLADLDGDAALEVIVGDSSGRLTVLDGTGAPAPFFNSGQPILSPPLTAAHQDSAAFRAGVPVPRGIVQTPAVADLDGDGSLEVVVVDTAGSVRAYDRVGTLRPGFPVGVDPALSAPALRTREYHVKTGIFAAPSVGDLDGDGAMEIVVGALDGRVYAWHADGTAVAGFPSSTNSADSGDRRGAELITTPTLAELDGTPGLEIVIAGSEVFDATGGTNPPESVTDLATAFRDLVNRAGSTALGGSSKIFALDADGSTLPGWPAVLDGLLPDVLPFIGPAHAIAAVDSDGDGLDELVVSNTTGEVRLLGADGSRVLTFGSESAAGLGMTDPGKVLNLFEYASVGDLEGLGQLSVVKGGISLGGLVNLVLVGQNQPFDHVVQSWDITTGAYKPGYPAKVEDFQLLSQPAIADVDGLPGNEILAGTGLYLIHALGAGGVEAQGFPKFTGGWNFATPSVGDLDGDGDVELVSATREGYLLAWSTGGDAAENDEAWGAAHDDRGTGRYGTDTRPPSRVQALTRSGTDVTWEATGDDWSAGTPARTVVLVDGVEQELSGTATSLAGIDPDNRVEVYAVDEAGNRSLSSILLPGASTGIAPPIDGGPTPVVPEAPFAVLLPLLALALAVPLVRRARLSRG